MRAILTTALLLLLWTPAARATVGDQCELNSECDSGEECRLQKCGPRHALPLPPDEPTKPSRHLSTSSVCMTPFIACPLDGAQRSGTICYCSTANGQVGGIIP